MTASFYEDLRRAVSDIRIVDTHEHLLQEEDRLKESVDVLSTFFSCYAPSDLRVAGMSKEQLSLIRDTHIPIEQRWQIFEPYWEHIRNTGYARVLETAVKDLYHVESIDRKTYLEISRKISEANQPGLYESILKKKAGIDVSLLDPPEPDRVDVDTRFFVPVRRFEDFILIRSRGDLESLERKCDRSIHSLSDLINALEMEFEKSASSIAAVKIGLAYQRPIYFEKTGYCEAEGVFKEIHSRKVFREVDVKGYERREFQEISLDQTRALQDFMVHKIIQLAIKYGLPVQIHAGVHEGTMNVVNNSHPTLLINLFAEYDEARFSVFHAGYPYVSEVASIAKTYPNVYVDMCWLYAISPLVAEQALSELLEIVPSNKILGFGGDYFFVEGTYGHSVLARRCIAKVLAEKVEEGSFSKQHAMWLAKRLLRENAFDLFLSRRSARS